MMPVNGGQWDGLVIVCAGTSWDGPWSSEKHLAIHLSATMPVLFIDPAKAIKSPDGYRDSRNHGGLQQVTSSLARLTPLVLPGMHRLGVPEVNELLVRRQMRHSAARLTSRVGAVIAAAPADFFGACGEKIKVVYATDDWVAGASLMGIPEAPLVRTEARLARKADVVVTVSPTLTDKWRRLGHNPVFVPNGCDVARFSATDSAPMPSDVDLPGPVAGFVGHLSDRIDISLLEAVAARGRSLLLVGARQGTFELEHASRLFSRPNVRWVGPKPFEMLPSYLRIIDVGLTPYSDTAFNRASFPLKTLEYLAAGRAAVTTDLPSVRWLETDLVVRASQPESFADAVDSALSIPRTDDIVARRRDFARGHGWDLRVAEIAEALGRGRPVGGLGGMDPDG